ncbi:baseplate J/gp47 family protein [Francisella tularensis]|uniref:baseplate J/gp47 family protein n=1 Tax=Francisella tularensis TaxID=263 RepID=UPI0008F4A93C|nr:baseplate J/gp47 family protein [Francisella tularensis]APA83240.1 hypothetical protein N894_1256 [Francisella tularensis subsp. novicida PA10-7858]
MLHGSLKRILEKYKDAGLVLSESSYEELMNKLNLQKQGFTPKTFDEVYKEITNIFKIVFGDGFNIDPASPNGLFIQELTNKAIENENVKTLIFGGLYNPDITRDIWLESLCKLLGLNRKSPSQSSVICTISGKKGTKIPKGSQVMSTEKDYFYLIDDVIIPENGSIDATFLSKEVGLVPVSAKSINKIVDNIVGWNAVINNNTGSLGSYMQTNASLRRDREEYLYLQGAGSIGSIKAALHSTKNVISVYVNDNKTNSSKTIDGVTIPANTIYCAVTGGNDKDIAASIYKKAPPGICLIGNTTIKGYDSENDISYEVSFQRPKITNVKIKIELTNNDNLPANLKESVAKALVDNFNGLSDDILKRVGIGDIINVSRFYPTLLKMGIFLVQNIKINDTNEIQLPADQIAVLEEKDVEVVLV